MERFKFLAKSEVNNLPKTSGVYMFKDNADLIYIGKAINLRERVKNHFNQPSYRDDLFIEKVNKIGFFETNSEIEALILEAGLIKKYQPKYNVVWRDDKNYFYVAFEPNSQKIPFIYITHQKNSQKTKYVGPFVEGTALKKTLKYLRRVFPYYTSKNHPKNKCTWCHLDLCPGPQVLSGVEGAEALKDYKKNIKKLILILQGKRGDALRALKKEMKTLSREKKFEEAGKIRDRISDLQQIMEHTRVINGGNLADGKNLSAFQWKNTEKKLQEILDLNRPINKIECYDISNIQGKQATGSMVTFVNGEPDKNQYKKFKIKFSDTPNDIAMLKEILERRFLHPEWKNPEIILIDGGKAQLNVAINVKNKINKKIKVISIAKGRQELFIEDKEKPIPLKSLPQEIYNLVKHLDDEAHRFAINYHKNLRSKKVFG